MPPADAVSPVLIIGGGAAGLSTAAALARRGIHATVLERDDQIGKSWTRRYQSLRLHTIRRFSGLAHYPIPQDQPRYLTKDAYDAYLQEYARALGLNVSLSERVESVRHLAGSPEGIDWEVVTNRGTRHTRVVVIATGQCQQPFMPAWEGMPAFSGAVLHSSDYVTGAAYTGQRALVVGLGNSGAEIAADLAAQGAASVIVSVRTAPPIVLREMFKLVPIQLLGIALTPLGMPRLFDRIGAALRRLSIGDLTAYGLGPPAWGPFTAKRAAVIDAGFIKQLKLGRIAIRPMIDRFEPSGVVYADGTREVIDVVIAATGFRTGLDTLLITPGIIDETGQPRDPSEQPTPAPGLYFVGFGETVRGQLFEINRRSKTLAVEVERFLLIRPDEV